MSAWPQSPRNAPSTGDAATPLAPGVEEHGLVPPGLLHRRFRHDRLLPVHRHTLADPCDHEPRDYERPADTSITLETIFLARQMDIRTAFRTAIGMSFISMIAMETVMNAVDRGLTGGAKLTWRVVPIMLAAGFVTPLPYNYWRLKVLGRACH